MMHQSGFDDTLQSLDNHAVEFSLAASLYRAGKVSFASAAHMAGLDFDGFKARLIEHFDQGYIVIDECVIEDMRTVKR